MTDDLSREEAVLQASAALLPMQTFLVRYRVTVRVGCVTHVEAFDLDDAIKTVKVTDLPGDWELERHTDIEGDEIAFVSPSEDYNNSVEEEIEVDLRQDGQPFSWTACMITQDLAQMQPDDIINVTALIERAKNACRKDQPNPRET